MHIKKLTPLRITQKKKFRTGLLLILNPFRSRLLLSSVFIVFTLLTNCSSSERFTSDEKYLIEEFKPAGNFLRVLLDEKPSTLKLNLHSKAFLYKEREKVAEIYSGNDINFSVEQNQMTARIGRKYFYGKYFQLVPADRETIDFNNKSFKGSLRIVAFGKYVNIINFIDLENYLKGVITKEMPTGNDMENFEALKAFAIAARTYTISKKNNGNILFDIYADTRDQVYGGSSSEELISTKAVEETENMILFYNNVPAKIYYHSTCGGITEDARNVFPQANVDYLVSVKDGEPPNCDISPRFEWSEEFSEDQFVNKLFKAGLITNNNYNVSDLEIVSKFISGRVNDLKIILTGNSGTKEIHLYGNEIRNIIRTPLKNLMLWSTLFTIERSSNGNIILNGKGFGHGVGLCQWGAIGLSQKGVGYKEILEHYYPYTKLGTIDD